MTAKTAIGWTTYTWNPWRGCVKKFVVDPLNGMAQLREECRNCYMYREQKRFYGVNYNPSKVVSAHYATFYKPVIIHKQLAKLPALPAIQERLVFTCSWSDWFNPEADEWRTEAWNVIRQAKSLHFQILTKLPGRIQSHLPQFWDEIRSRVWLGVTAGYQLAADAMLPHLFAGFDSSNRPAVFFVSVEPMLEMVYLSPWLGKNHLDWVIIGGESGPDCRPLDIFSASTVIRACDDAEVPVFFKQIGGYPNKRDNPAGWPVFLKRQEWPLVVEKGI